MPEDPKATLHRYLRRTRDALLWKLDGLGDYDVRRPMTPTGTNLLGLVKHTAAVGSGYLCDTFGRRFAYDQPWFADDADLQADMFAAADESRADIVRFWHDAWAASDEMVDSHDLDALGEVPWWPAERNPVSLHYVLVHLIDELARHAGQADIVRELIDERVGVRADNANLPDVDANWWRDYRARLEQIARQSL
ncbi:DinB family protein [uncultured Jatrophihabitans sp.]|uniref:DinB family protein n=1 Tax=uncultured Jatrophihabitans sp. TaxID=1610747 RepID=UPI0035C966A2